MTYSSFQSKKKYAPATQRNREPILTVLKEILPSKGKVLEIASGTGEHALFFAENFPQLQWIPSDINPESLLSIAAWRQDCQTHNLQPPLRLDMMQTNWQRQLIQSNIIGIICINMIHISPWQSFLGLMTGAKQILPKDGVLYFYGPYKVNNKHTAPSNQEFDESLKSQNPDWGVRNLNKVIEIGNKCNFKLEKIVEMPANNLSLIFRHL